MISQESKLIREIAKALEVGKLRIGYIFIRKKYKKA